MATYSVKKGTHDFKPNDSILPTWASAREFLVTLTPSMWWDANDPEWLYGKDIFDHNKLFGLTGYFSANNKNSIMWSFRPWEEINQFEATPYINNRDGSFETGPPIIVNSGEVHKLKVDWERRNAVFYVAGEEHFRFAKRRPWVLRKLSAWIGGNRPALRDMNLEMTEV